MPREKHAELESSGTESSFLDVTTNIIGILIILVMLVGEHAGKAVLELAANSAISRELQTVAPEAAQLEQDVYRLASQMAKVQQEMRLRSAERGQLSTLITAVEGELVQRRAALDTQSQARYDHQRDLALAGDELERLKTARTQSERAKEPETIKIENYPTPIGKTVDTKEAHFQLLHGRLAFLPYDTLVDRLRSSLREQASRLSDQAELVDTLGPVEGFRLRYVIQRSDTPGGTLVQVTYIEFIPVSSQSGEPMDAALKPGSNFRRALELLSPGTYTITVWTYPDSFAEFRELQKDLHALGYSVAARPLPEGAPIGASPHGTKSSAE